MDWSRLAETLRVRALLPVIGPRILEPAEDSASGGFAARRWSGRWRRAGDTGSEAGGCGGPSDWLEVSVEDIGVEVVAVWSYDGAQLGIDAHLAEAVGVSTRLGHRTPEISREVDLANQAVGKRQS